VNRLVLLVAAVVCVGVLASPVAAQQTTDTPTPEPSTDTPTPEPSTDTPTPESSNETAEQGTDERPITSPSGSPVTYDSPTPTSGDGPGFGVIGALVAVVSGTAVVARRRA